MSISDKAVLSTKEACAYCGGRPTFEKLQEAYPELIKPFSKGKSTGTRANGSPARGKTTYLKSVIDLALKAAQMERKFVS